MEFDFFWKNNVRDKIETLFDLDEPSKQNIKTNLSNFELDIIDFLGNAAGILGY